MQRDYGSLFPSPPLPSLRELLMQIAWKGEATRNTVKCCNKKVNERFISKVFLDSLKFSNNVI